MQAREDYLKRIIREISIWRYEIELRGAVNLYDSHIIAQYYIKCLLNIAYGYCLEDLDDETKIQVGIDLGDQQSQIAFQVTATARRSKIEDTITKFIDHSLHKRFHELYFFILSKKLSYRKNFDTQGLFNFDKKENILDFDDLIRKVRTLTTPQLAEIVDFLEQEATSEQISKPNLKIILKYYPQTGLGTSFLVRLVNVSQPPITITNVFLRLKSGEQISYTELRARYIQLSAPLPLTLQATEFCDFLFPLYFMYELKNGKVTNPLDITSVEACDSLDKRYKYPLPPAESQETFLQLQEQIQRHWEKDAWLP